LSALDSNTPQPSPFSGWVSLCSGGDKIVKTASGAGALAETLEVSIVVGTFAAGLSIHIGIVGYGRQ